MGCCLLLGMALDGVYLSPPHFNKRCLVSKPSKDLALFFFNAMILSTSDIDKYLGHRTIILGMDVFSSTDLRLQGPRKG